MCLGAVAKNGHRFLIDSERAGKGWFFRLREQKDYNLSSELFVPQGDQRIYSGCSTCRQHNMRQPGGNY